MAVESPLSNLCQVLEEVKTSSKTYSATLITSEAATRAVLIDPVLRALGWDTANTTMVEVEKPLSNTARLDYALNSRGGNLEIVVEAKKRGENLLSNQVTEQLANYVFKVTPQNALPPVVFLTDGIIWHRFNDLRPGNISPSTSFNLENDDVVNCAAKFVEYLDAAKYWFDTSGVGLSEVVLQLESQIADLRQELNVIYAKVSIRELSHLQSKPEAQPVIPSGDYTLLRDLKPADLTGSRPKTLRLPDGRTIPVSTWAGVLAECCKFFLLNVPLFRLPLPDMAGRKRKLISYEKPEGLSSLPIEHQGNNAYILTNYSAIDCVVNSMYVLDKVPNENKVIEAAVIYQRSANR